MPESAHNPHAGRPFTDDDATIAAALKDLSVPALLCSMVHLTGDPSWIRTDLRPHASTLNDYTGGMSEDEQAAARAWALPAILAFRDGGCVLPPAPSDEVIREMMAFLACAPLDDDVVPMFLEDLHLDGADARAITWADEVPDDVRADAHVVVIGCGESGLLAALRLAQAKLPFTVIEKNGGPGGTWWENRYPGARVDIGSHFYCYSFEPADHWTEYFSQHPELRAYFRRVLDAHDLEPHCRWNTRVDAMTYDEATGRWAVDITNPDGSTEVLDARAVISAVGALNTPRLPDIPGMDDFQGPSFHSARWDHSVEYEGKKFALVGAGASGFQIAPTIADDVEQLTVYQRTAQWVFPNPNYHREVPDGERWAIRHLPFFGRWFRFLTFYPGAGLSVERNRIDPDYDDGGLSVSEGNRATRELFSALMLAQLGDDEELAAKVMPDYPPTAKRMLQDNGSWLACSAEGQCRAGAHRHRADRRRRRDHRRRHVPSRRHHLLRDRFPAQRLPLADAHRRTSRRGAARPVGDRTRGLPRYHDQAVPQPVLPVRAGHEPRPRREPHLPVGEPGRLRDAGVARAADVGSPRARAAARGAGRLHRRATPARSRRWCGRTSQ